MLREFKDVRQIQGEGIRRWFYDDFFDLIVWYKEGRVITGFQLCFDKQNDERALTWYADAGYTFDRIDSGETPGEPKRTPVLVQDGTFDTTEIAEKFRNAGRTIDIDIADFIYEKIASVRFQT